MVIIKANLHLKLSTHNAFQFLYSSITSRYPNGTAFALDLFVRVGSFCTRCYGIEK